MNRNFGLAKSIITSVFSITYGRRGGRGYTREAGSGAAVTEKTKAQRDCERRLEQLLPVQLHVGMLARSRDFNRQIGSGAVLAEDRIEGRQQHALRARHGLRDSGSEFHITGEVD